MCINTGNENRLALQQAKVYGLLYPYSYEFSQSAARKMNTTSGLGGTPANSMTSMSVPRQFSFPAWFYLECFQHSL